MKRILRHLLFAAAGCGVVAATATILREDPSAQRLSMGTAYAALFFLCAALSLGPWYALTTGRRPASTPLRRDVAIWSALFALAHVVVGLQVHFGGRWLNYFAHIEAGQMALRVDAFGAANHIGLVAGLGLLVLLIISNDAAMRGLGIAQWRRWQSAAPWLGVLTLVHAALYQVIEKRAAMFVAVTVLVAGAVVAMRVARARVRPQVDRETTERGGGE